MLDIITIGSATKDVFLISKNFKLVKSKDFSTGVGECFAYGAKVDIGDLVLATGGGATNAAATMTNLGIKTGIYSQVGEDIFGKEIVADLKKRKIDSRNVHVHKKLKTGYSTILLSAQGDRTILVYRGASQEFDPKQISADKLKSKWFYLTGAAGNLAFVKKVFEIAHKNNTYVFWNPGGGELTLGMNKMKPFLSKTQILSLNKEEAQKLTGFNDVKRNLQILGAMVPIVWITDGKVGAYASVVGETYFIPSLGTPALNATGAGDAFGSGFVAGLIISGDWQYAAKLAIFNSDSVIRQMGAKTGLLKKKPTTAQLAKVKIRKF